VWLRDGSWVGDGFWSRIIGSSPKRDPSAYGWVICHMDVIESWSSLRIELGDAWKPCLLPWTRFSSRLDGMR